MSTSLAPASASSRQEVKRKPYTKPQLINYGHVKDIVKGMNGTNTDSGHGSDSRLGACWIAEALYGVDAPQTALVRAWLLQASEQTYGWWLFHRLYVLVGRDVAALITNGRLPRSLPLPVFNALFRKANAAFARRLKEDRGGDTGAVPR